MTCACCRSRTEQGSVRLLCRSDVELCYECVGWLHAKKLSQIAASGSGARIDGSDPIFVVRDVARAKDHYERLGFATHDYDETYAFASRDDVNIHLDGGPERPPGGGVLYLHVDDAHQLAAEWRLAGLAVDGPDDYDWGKTEGSHVDPDGNLIRFGSPRMGSTAH